MKSFCKIGNIAKIAPLLKQEIQAVVTSPPYYGLRWYEIEPVILGGDPLCDHDFAELEPPRQRSEGDVKDGGSIVAKGANYNAQKSHICRKCGAWRGQLGQEPNPQMYVEHLADIFDMLPLRKDGLLFCNIKDTSIAGKGKSGHSSQEKGAKRREKGETITPAHSNIGGKGVLLPTDDTKTLRRYHLKPKDLALVPARLALEMQKRGWWYRQEIIWAKTNPQPESVIDRLPCTHEKILVFAKSKHYKYDRYAIKRPCATSTLARYERGVSGEGKYSVDEKLYQGIAKRRPSKTKYGRVIGNTIQRKREEEGKEYLGRDYRSLDDIWRMPTAQHRSKVGAHVAPMPMELPRRCIELATTKGDWVLDPFAGTGTVCVAAEILGRKWIGVDLDSRLPEFIKEGLLARNRMTAQWRAEAKNTAEKRETGGLL